MLLAVTCSCEACADTSKRIVGTANLLPALKHPRESDLERPKRSKLQTSDYLSSLENEQKIRSYTGRQLDFLQPKPPRSDSHRETQERELERTIPIRQSKHAKDIEPYSRTARLPTRKLPTTSPFTTTRILQSGWRELQKRQILCNIKRSLTTNILAVCIACSQKRKISNESDHHLASHLTRPVIRDTRIHDTPPSSKRMEAS